MLEEKIKNLYQNLYFQKVRAKKIITMLKVIVIDGMTDIYDIAKKANTTEETAKNYINNKELILEFLTEQEYIELVPFIDRINNKVKREKETEKHNIVKGIITDILETRFKLEDVRIRNNITSMTYEKLMKDEAYLIDNFGDDIINKLKFRIEETKIIRMSAPRDKKIIEEAWDLKVVKDKIHYLDSYEYKLLKVVSNYLMNDSDINLTSQNLDMPEQMVYNYLVDPKVKDLIKEEYYNKLQTYINYETILREKDLNTKRDLIKQALLALQQSNYNIKETCENSGIQYGLLKRILLEDLMFILLSHDEVEKVRELFNGDKSNKKTR